MAVGSYFGQYLDPSGNNDLGPPKSFILTVWSNLMAVGSYFGQYLDPSGNNDLGPPKSFIFAVW